MAIFSLGAFNFSFVLLNAKESGIADPFIPLVYVAINIAHTFIGIPAGMLSDRVGRQKVLIMGYAVFSISSVLILLAPKTGLYAFIIAFMFGLYAGIVETLQRALVPRYSVNGLVGTAYGLYYLVVGTSFFIANIVVGSFWQSFGSSIAVSYSITMSIIAICCMLILLNREKRK